MHVAGNNVKFNGNNEVTEAHTNGVLTDLGYAKYQEDLIGQKTNVNQKQVKKDTKSVSKDKSNKA